MFRLNSFYILIFEDNTDMSFNSQVLYSVMSGLLVSPLKEFFISVTLLIFFLGGGGYTSAETPVLWPPHAKS